MNKFTEALNARIEVATSKNSNARNVAMLTTFAACTEEKAFAKLLSEAKISERAFSEAMYVTEKLIKLCYSLINRTRFDVNENAVAAFKTAMLCADNNVKLTRQDIRASLSRDEKSDHVVFQRQIILDPKTVDAQAQQCIAMLFHMNIIDSANKRDKEFTVKTSKLTEALREHYMSA